MNQKRWATWKSKQENHFNQFVTSTGNAISIITNYKGFSEFEENQSNNIHSGRPTKDKELAYLRYLLSTFRQSEKMIETKDKTGKAIKEFLGPDYKCSLTSPVRSKRIWIEIASALQNDCVINYNEFFFKNINAINSFIISIQNTTSGSSPENSELNSYGLYIRRVNDLVIAYSILHGIQFDEIFDNNCGLVKRAHERLLNRSYNTNPNVNATNELFEQFREFTDLDDVDLVSFNNKSENIEAFLDTIETNKNMFLDSQESKEDSHGSTINSISNNLIPSPADKYCDIKKFASDIVSYMPNKNHYDYDNLIEQYIPSAKSQLRDYIIRRLKYLVDVDKNDDMRKYIREAYIVYLMNLHCNENLTKPINEIINSINEKLNAALLREIEYGIDGSVVISTSNDQFDYFITNFIIINPSNYGYNAFFNYINSDTEETKQHIFEHEI